MGIYSPKEICPLASLVKGKIALPVDQAVDRPTVIFMTVEPPVDQPLDRRLETESKALCRSTGRSTGAISREQKLSAGRPTRSIGLPAKTIVHICARRSTGPVDRLLPRSTVRSTSRRLGQTVLGINT